MIMYCTVVKNFCGNDKIANHLHICSANCSYYSEHKEPGICDHYYEDEVTTYQEVKNMTVYPDKVFIDDYIPKDDIVSLGIISGGQKMPIIGGEKV